VNKHTQKTYYVNKPALILIGNKIREVRTDKGISIENLAYSSGMDYSQLAKMELGQVNLVSPISFVLPKRWGYSKRITSITAGAMPANSRVTLFFSPSPSVFLPLKPSLCVCERRYSGLF